MTNHSISRRNLLAGMGASLTSVAGARLLGAQTAAPAIPAQGPSDHPFTGQPQPGDADRARRMQWWHQARFGMFIHFGVYSTFERHEWEMENEAVPFPEYTANARIF